MKPLVLIGPMGVGKTTIGRSLAQQLNIEFQDSDLVIVERTGASIPWIFDIEGEEGFRNREQKILDELTQQKNLVLATGGGAILRSENQRVLSERAVVIYLQASLDQLLQRTEKDKNRPLLQQSDPEKVIRKLIEARTPIYERLADLMVNTTGRRPKAVAGEIINRLRQGALI